MKLLSVFCLIIVASNAIAQQLSGVVKDESSLKAIGGAQVYTKNATAITDASGQFTLSSVKVGDRISFRLMGYETQEIQITTKHFKEAFFVNLKAVIINLNEVNIRVARRRENDSIMRRKEYAAIFNFRTQSFEDMFVKINPEQKVPAALARPASTASIATINVIQVLRLFGKKKTQTSKLKATLLADEAAEYVNKRFSQSKVEDITKLKDDSLKLFISRFKPSLDEMKKMNDYQLSIYIKEKHLAFTKP